MRKRDVGDGQPRRALGTFDATAVVIGAIVGVGIFFTPSRVAALAGSADLALLAWALGGGAALLGALTFAELGAMYPHSGGQYEVLRDGFGAPVGFTYVVCNATATQAGSIAIIAIVTVQNGAIAIADVSLHPLVVAVAAAALTASVAVTNAFGVRWGSLVQNATVVAKLAALATVVVIALWADTRFEGFTASHGGPSPALHPLWGLTAALVPVLFSYGGWQQVSWIGGEVKAPERTLPRAILGGVVIVVAVYLGANWAYLSLLGHEGVAGSATVASDAVAVVFASSARRTVAAAIAISALGVLNAQLLTGPRLVYALARDGRFFSVFGRLHARFDTPVPAIALMSATAVILLFAAGERGIDRLLTGVVLVDAVFFALTGLASVVLARRQPHAKRPVRMPGFPLVPLAFFAIEAAVVVGSWMDPEVRAAAMIGVAWIAACAVLYAVRFRDQNQRVVSSRPDARSTPGS